MSINITYDVEDMKNKTENFSEKFKAIEAIKSGDKIGIDELGHLYIQYNGLFQVTMWDTIKKGFMLMIIISGKIL